MDQENDSGKETEISLGENSLLIVDVTDADTKMISKVYGYRDEGGTVITIDNVKSIYVSGPYTLFILDSAEVIGRKTEDISIFTLEENTNSGSAIDTLKQLFADDE